MNWKVTRWVCSRRTPQRANARNASVTTLQGADGQHKVLLDSLRVLLVQDDGGWTAQGLEVDYAASGRTLEEAKDHFAKGLTATIVLYLQRFDSVEKLLRVAPDEVWKQFHEAIAGGASGEPIEQIDRVDAADDCGLAQFVPELRFYEPEAVAN